MRARAICVCRDERVGEVVGGALAEAGVDTEHRSVVPADPGQVALIVVDRATREAEADALRDVGAPVVVVGDDLDDDGLITLMLEAPVSHLVKDPGDRDIAITSEKLVSGDVFGLEKYLAPDARVREREVHDDIGKRAAIHEVTAWAESIGARKPVVHRLASVIDELLMNALIDAPRESKPLLSLDDTSSSRCALLRWAHDGQTIAISVTDRFGAIRQRDVIDHVRRARRERGRPRPPASAGAGRGAGIGLYLVLGNVASLVVNVEAGKRTEVVCLFDRTTGRPAARCARSLHVFQTAR
jgi:anti-sigma regulatory factor (Ser/Thr protein kinase)